MSFKKDSALSLHLNTPAPLVTVYRTTVDEHPKVKTSDAQLLSASWNRNSSALCQSLARVGTTRVGFSPIVEGIVHQRGSRSGVVPQGWWKAIDKIAKSLHFRCNEIVSVR